MVKSLLVGVGFVSTLAVGLTFLDVALGLAIVTSALVTVLGLVWNIGSKLVERLRSIERSIDSIKAQEARTADRLERLERLEASRCA